MPGIHCLCMHVCMALQVFLGNLETTVILVHVAQPYITEAQELLHQAGDTRCSSPSFFQVPGNEAIEHLPV